MEEIEIEVILFEIIKTRLEKSECIGRQEYEKSAQLRDTEKQLLDKLFKHVYGDDDKHIYNSCDDYVNEWCVKKYGFSYKDVSFTQFKRQMLLNKLDI